MDIPEINAGGVRHSEIARRLRVTGYPAEKITETSKYAILWWYGWS